MARQKNIKNYAVLETVHIGDVVTVRHKKLNLDLQGRVNKIIYTVDSEGNTSIDSVEIGFTKKQITDIIKDTAITANTANNKINQITETSEDGVTTELSKKAFKVTCSKASGTNVTIDAEGLTVNNGKILVKNSNGETVFYVNTSGLCNAVGGFKVEDGDTSCFINSQGMKLVGANGTEANIQILDETDHTGVYMPDDLYVNGWLGVNGVTNLIGDVFVGEITLQDYIINIIESVVKADSLK